MAKPVSIRASYRDDAAFLIRLEKAVEKDQRQDKTWREGTMGKIKELYQRLLSAKAGPQPSSEEREVR